MKQAPALYRPGARLAACYWLDSAKLVTRLTGQDLGPALAGVGVMTANVAPHDACAESATPWQAIPRKPISVYRLARNLSLPYETARRYVGVLVEAGVCERVDGGVIVPVSFLGRADAESVVRDLAFLGVELARGLQNLGLQTPEIRLPLSEDQIRRVARLGMAFFLGGVRTTVDRLRLDLVSAILFLAIYVANRAELLRNPELARAVAAPDTVRPDGERTPVTVFSLAQDMRLPYETARRHVQLLIRRGLVAKAPNGLIVPAEALSSPMLVDGTTRAWRLTQEFVARAFQGDP